MKGGGPGWNTGWWNHGRWAKFHVGLLRYAADGRARGWFEPPPLFSWSSLASNQIQPWNATPVQRKPALLADSHRSSTRLVPFAQVRNQIAPIQDEQTGQKAKRMVARTPSSALFVHLRPLFLVPIRIVSHSPMHVTSWTPPVSFLVLAGTSVRSNPKLRG